jgi:Lipid A 3-O-deacylase (PagL)
VLGLWVLTPAPSPAEEESNPVPSFRLLNVGIRGGVDGPNVFGADEQEHFQQYDIFATATLPWDWRFASGWGFSPRLMGTAGVLIGAGEAAFVTTIVPLLAFGPKNSILALDAGVGAALMTRHKFGEQNFGGAFQVVLTFGLRVPVYRAFGIGYRMAHMSDAKIYGEGRGVDVHMLELTYTFR